MSSGRITSDEVLTALEETGAACEPVTAVEIAEELGYEPGAVRTELDELAERGALDSKEVGDRSQVWWRTETPSTDDGSASDGDALEIAPARLEGSTSDAAGREHLETELEEVFDRISDAFYALDADWRFTHANDRAEELIDYRGEGLVGENLWEVFEWAEDSRLGREYREAMATGEPTTFEFYYPEPLAAWYEVHAYPSETGLSVYFRDVTERKERERRLEESERRYRTLVEHFPNGAVALVDEDLRYVTFGGTPGGDADVTRDDLEGEPLRDALPPELAEVVVPGYEAALDGEKRAFEETVGDEVYKFQFLPVRNDDGEVFAALGMSQDVTDRREYERALERSERRFRALVENFPNGAVTIYDEDLRYITAGGENIRRIGLTGEEMEGSRLREVVPDGLAEQMEPNYRAAVEREEHRTFEAEYDGHHFEFHALPLYDDDGEVFAALGMSQNVTDRRRYERRLEESERRYRTLVENFPNGAVGLFDEDLRYTVAGGEALDEVNAPPEEIVGKTVRERYPEEIADRFESTFRATLDGEKCAFEVEFHDRDWLVRTVPVSDDDDGTVVAGMVMVQDITEQKERERDLQDAKSQLEAAAEAGAVGTFEWHVPEDRMVTGAAFARTFGVDPEAAREGVSIDRFIDAVHEDDRERVERGIEAALASCGEYEAEYRVRNADGELRWVVARGHVECDEAGEPATFPGALADITERKRAELKLEAHRKQLETLFEVLPVGVVVADADGRLIEANETAREIWGDDAFDAESVADYERYAGWWADAGEPVDPEEWTMARVLRGEEVTDPDVFEIETENGERRTIMVHGMPVRDESGDVSRGVITQTDVTERREYRNRLEKSNERLERFASMLAHELRNPVTIGQIYSDQLPADSDDEAVAYVTEAFDRIEETIEVMLVLTRGREAVGERTAVELGDVAAEAWTDVDAPEATLEVRADGTIHADRTYVRHLFRNLFENAVEHGGRDVTITVDDHRTGFYVADDGAGIPADDRDAVFEAGFTTAADDDGTGLGLAFVDELADVYGWDVSVTESEAGGARFEFRGVE